MRKIIIFCPFRERFEPIGGSPIRIKGYVLGFMKENIDFFFMSKKKPEYINDNIFLPFNLKNYYNKLFLIHNILFHFWYAKPIVFILKIFLLLNPKIKNLTRLLPDKLIITHQENSICYFLFLYYKIDFVYDIHGILTIQQEYTNTMNSYARFWFQIRLKHESFLFNDILYANCINESMRAYITNKLSFKGNTFFAPDGFLDIKKIFDNTYPKINDLRNKYFRPGRKVILFFGEFKFFGGVHLLVETFSKMVKHDKSIFLILIGTGQMEKTVRINLLKNQLEKYYVHIPKVHYNLLKDYMELSDAIVIPDIDNVYNKMIPHIKLFDCLASGKPFVLPNFQINIEILKRLPNNAILFNPDSIDDMANKIKIAFTKEKKIYTDSDRKKFMDFSYEKFAKNLIAQLELVF